MKLIPNVKEFKQGERRELKGCTFIFPENCDKRVINLASKIPQGDTVVKVSVYGIKGENYKITFKDEILISASSYQGAFYAIQTIRQIVKNGYYDVSEIVDGPDFGVRGFYYDITRGRIPTLETLKTLVDTLAYYKMNMLQLYVEHVFPFEEYDGVYQRTGYMTPEETKELDRYCRENFVELVPALSCFGHLYELLQNGKYKHLCEYESYKPEAIEWCERMEHHTIDVSNPESIEVIKSLINQYAPLFTSDKFNICCDETFDLCNGRNAGKDKAREYVNFVNKIVAHVKSLGKKPMMWGDIISQHAELIGELDEDITYLSWEYSPNPSPDCIEKIKEAKRPQYVCPGLNNWASLMELTHRSIPNITKMAKFGWDASARGLLTTCWGDYGHTSPLEACMYGLIYSSDIGWNINGNTDTFDKRIDFLHYGYEGASSLIKKLSEANKVNYWWDLCAHISNLRFNNSKMCAKTPDPDELNSAFAQCEEILPYLMASKWENEDARNTFVVVAQGIEYMIAMLVSIQCGEKCGVNMNDVEEWLKEYAKLYLKESKRGELQEFVKVMYELALKYLA